MKIWMIVLFVVALMAANTSAAQPAPTGWVFLTLQGGVRPPSPGDLYTCDMELELTLRDGKFEPKVWGYALTLNKAYHEGNVVSADGDKLAVKLTINKDKWFPAVPGEAEYQLTLKREGDAYTGAFTGTLQIAGKDGPQKRELAGKIVGRAYPLWTEPAPGFKKLEPNEHPRAIFRKSDLPAIKKHLETPEGKAIMARFMQVLPEQHATHTKNKPFFPAGYALAYQLTGDKAHADKAREILADMLNLGGSQDIHYGPIAQSMAVTLDLCYDAWDAEFRQKVIDNLARRVANLNTLTGMGGASLNPWHNHEGVRAGSLGVAAIVLLGEKTSDGKEIPGLERMVMTSALTTRRYFLYNGSTNTGWPHEGSFYKRMTFNSGMCHMIQAYRSAFGGDLMAGWWGHWVVLGEWMQQPPADPVVAPEDLGNDQSAGMWPLMFSTVPDSMKAGARWQFDHAFGLEGNRTFGLHWAYHAGYLLMGYPFEVAPRHPSESMPWIAPDPTGGHWIFRKPWKGAQDTLIVLHPRFSNPGGTHWTVGKSWDMQLFALGKQWVGDRQMAAGSQGQGAALPTTSDKEAFNIDLSARCTDWMSTPEGKATLSFDMSPIYLQAAAKGTPAGPTVKRTRAGTFIDHGIKASRHVALDLSGDCGAPVLMAFLDKSQGAKDFTWNLRLARDAGAAKVDGNTITVGDPAGANMKVTFIAPKAPALTDRITATGGEEYFAIITVQNGAAPAVKVDGEGLAAKATVGGVTVSLSGEKIELKKK